tara:strand:- start:683 stop:1354 length:672 start_codon:yes stop_codon:yes gene_type:complete
MKNIIIVGNGGFAAEIIQYLNDFIGTNREKDKESTLKILGIVDNYAPKDNQESVDGIKFLGKEDDIKESEDNFYLIASGKPEYRKSAYERLKNKGKKLFTLIHPNALISNNCFIGEGSIICPNTIINAKSKIGKCSVVNVFSSVGHHSKIGDFCVLSPFCSISGSASVGDSCFLGTRTTLFPNINLGKFCTIDSHTYVKSNTDNYTIVSLRSEYLLLKDRFKT